MPRLPTRVLETVSGKPAVFFVGAGISRDSPTCFPTGTELASAVVHSVAIKDSVARRYIGLLANHIQRGRQGCRLEVLLEIGRQGIGERVLHILDFLDLGEPNIYHYLLAFALLHKSIVITTNFDCMIEEAYCRISGGLPPVIIAESDVRKVKRRRLSQGLLFKVHGSLRDSSGNLNYDSIQATVASMANGLAGWKRQVLQTSLVGKDVVFIGYSGNDDFDIAPALLDITCRRVVWVKYRSQPLLCQKNALLGLSRTDFLHTFLTASGSPFLLEGDSKELMYRLPYLNEARKFASRKTRSVSGWVKKLDQTLIDLSLSDFQRIRYIGKLLQYNHLLKEAHECLQHNRGVARGLDRAVATDDLAQWKFLSREFDEDLKLRQTARRIAKRFSTNEGVNIIARTWLGSGESWRHTRQYKRSMKCFARAATLYLKLKNYSKAAYSIAGMAGIYRMTSSFAEAKRCYRRAIDYFNKSDELAGSLYASWGTAELYKYDGNFGEAFRIYRKVGALAEKLGHDSLKAWAIYGEAEIARLERKLTDATALYSKAYTTFPGKDLGGRSWAREGRAQCSILGGMSASRDLAKAWAGFTTISAGMGRLALLLDRANDALVRRDFSEAESTLQNLESYRLPLRERAHYAMLKGILHAATSRSGGRFFRFARIKYQVLGMKHAFVMAVIMAYIHDPASLHSTRDFLTATRIAKHKKYVTEADVLLRLKGKKLATYNLNLY